MDLLLVFLSTAIGTIVGVVAAVVMMNRRNRPAATGDPALRTQLQNTEWALTAAGRDVEELRKQLTEREGVREELERTQQQLASLMADKEKQSAQRAAAEQRAAEAAEEVAGLRDRVLRMAELETALANSARAREEMQQHLESAGDTSRHAIELQACLTAAEERATTAEGTLAELDRRAVELQALLTAAMERATAAEGTAAELDRRVEAAEGTVGELRRELQAAVEELERRAEMAEAALAASGRERDMLRRDLESAGAEIDRHAETADAALAEARRERDELRRELDAAGDVSRRVIELQAGLTAAEERAELAQAETALLRERVGVLAEESARIAPLEAEVEALQAQGQRASTTIEELEAMLCKERQASVEAVELMAQIQGKLAGRPLASAVV